MQHSMRPCLIDAYILHIYIYIYKYIYVCVCVLFCSACLMRGALMLFGLLSPDWGAPIFVESQPTPPAWGMTCLSVFF